MYNTNYSDGGSPRKHLASDTSSLQTDPDLADNQALTGDGMGI